MYYLTRRWRPVPKALSPFNRELPRAHSLAITPTSRGPHVTTLAFTIAFAGTILLIVAACGGDDGSGSGSGEPLTKAEFVEAADAICAEADEKNNALPEPETLEEAPDVLRQGLEIFEEQLNDLQALTPPEEGRETIDRAVVLLGEVNEMVSEAADLFEDGDLEGAQAQLEGLDVIGEELDELAADYGLAACGSSS